MMEAVRTSEMSVDNHFTRQYIPEDNSEHHTRRRENLKSQMKHNLITEDQLAHNYVIISQFSQKLQKKSYHFTLSTGFSSLLVHRTDLCGLRTNECQMVSTCFALTDGLPVLLIL
jgi:hypothetical protein